MARRKESETVQTGLRMKEQLRTRLEEAARARGVSLNAEIVARLERSFEQDNAFGSPDARQIAYMTAAAFNLARQMRGADDPGWKAAALFAAIDALIGFLPKMPPELINLYCESLKGNAIARQLREQGVGQ